MIPILYEAKETAFANNGLGRLAEAVRCIVTEELNGRFELEAEIPITAKHYGQIEDRALISATHDETKTRQPFRVYRSSKPINGIVTFGARHISYQLADTVLMPFSAQSAAQAMSRIPGQCQPQTDFTFWTDVDAAGPFEIKEPTNCRAALGGSDGSILDTYGGEYAWNGFQVRLYAQRGADRGVTIRYGKNLLDITDETDSGSSYNAILPYWTDGETVIMLPEVMLYAATIPGYTEPWTDHNLTAITNQSGTVLEFGIPAIKAQPMDLSDAFDEAPTAAQMREEANRRFNAAQAWKPERNIKIDFVALQNTEEYADMAALQHVALGDTVTVIYPALGTSAKLRVVKTVYNVLLDRYDEIELGDLKSTYGQQILQKADEKITKLPTKSYLEAAIAHATDLISGGLGGHVVFTLNADGEPEEILIMDTDNIETAVNVWRFNQGGLGHSSTGYAGPYADIALTMDGQINASMITTGIINASLIRAGAINADLITTGHLSANRIKAGLLQDETGLNYWNLNTGEFQLTGNLLASASYDGITGIDGGYVRTEAGSVDCLSEQTYRMNNTVGFSVYSDQPLTEGGALKRVMFHTITPHFFSAGNNDWGTSVRDSTYCSGSEVGDAKYTRIVALDLKRNLYSNNNANTRFYVEDFTRHGYSGGRVFTLQRRIVTGTTINVDIFEAPCEYKFSTNGGINFYLHGQAYQSSWGSNSYSIYLEAYNAIISFLPGATFAVTTTSAKINNKTVAYTSTSSRRYKEDIKALEAPELDPHRLYDLPVRQFKYHDGMTLQYDDMAGQLLPGFIAEEVEQIYPAAVIRKTETNEIESWDERRIIPGMLKLIQEQKAKIDELEERLASIEAALQRR